MKNKHNTSENFDEEELFEQYNFKIPLVQAPVRIDKFLSDALENTSRNKIQKAAEVGNILVNGEIVKSNYKIKPNDEVNLILVQQHHESDVIAENIPLNIVYEDDHVLVVNKTAGLVVHPGHGNYTGTLVNALKHHFDNLPNLDAEMDRPGLVHRIDKDTSGLLVIAKTEFAMNHLAKQFHDRTTERRYIALVWGNVEDDEGKIETYIGRHPKDRTQMSVYDNESHGKLAITHYKVIERLGYTTLLECKLETGRTHQIRVHMKHIGHTLFNDEKYGGDKILKGTSFSKYKQFVENCFKLCPRQALHAKTLGFEHPSTGEKMFFDSEIPEDIEAILNKWRIYSNATLDE